MTSFKSIYYIAIVQARVEGEGEQREEAVSKDQGRLMTRHIKGRRRAESRGGAVGKWTLR